MGTAQTNNPSGGGLVSRAVEWDLSGGVTDLNALLPANSGWVLTSAQGVNDSGFIVGFGTKSGVTKPYLLFPKRNVN